MFTVEQNDEQSPVLDRIVPRQESRLRKADLSSYSSDENIVTVPTSKGGMRRKHHRAWTLAEVMKLIEGVSRCGAGRWSEIKRLSFASYSYRTSVDLKVLLVLIYIPSHLDVWSTLLLGCRQLNADFLMQDKWRNLLKASFSKSALDEGVSSDYYFTLFLLSPAKLTFIIPCPLPAHAVNSIFVMRRNNGFKFYSLQGL